MFFFFLLSPKRFSHKRCVFCLSRLSVAYVSIGGVTTDYIVSLFGVLFYSKTAINHTFTQFSQCKENFIDYPMARNELFSFYFLLCVCVCWFLHLFVLCFLFLFFFRCLASYLLYAILPEFGFVFVHVSCIFFEKSKHKYANNSSAFHISSVYVCVCFY